MRKYILVTLLDIDLKTLFDVAVEVRHWEQK